MTSTMFKRHALWVTLLGLLTLLQANKASACGLHSELSIRQTLLNLRYPNASWVMGDVWSGQQAGVLPFDRKRFVAIGPELEFRNNIALAAMIRAQHALGAALETSPGESSRPDISMVLVESMLWIRFPAEGSSEFHANGPLEKDLVIVTDEPVVHEIEAGRLSVTAAVEAGYMRIYGSSEQQKSFLTAYGSLGTEPLPLPKLDARTLFGQIPKSSSY